MDNLKNYHCSGHNILLVDKKGVLHIIGDNNSGKTSISPDVNPLRAPAKISAISLDEDEVILTFKSCPHNLFFHTNKQRLYELRTLNNKPYGSFYDPTKVSSWKTLEINIYSSSSHEDDQITNQMSGTEFGMQSANRIETFSGNENDLPSLEPDHQISFERPPVRVIPTVRRPRSPSRRNEPDYRMGLGTHSREEARLTFGDFIPGLEEDSSIMMGARSEPSTSVSHFQHFERSAPQITRDFLANPNRMPLEWNEFNLLSQRQRTEYVTALRTDIDAHMGELGSWTNISEMFARALDQIESISGSLPIPSASEVEESPQAEHMTSVRDFIQRFNNSDQSINNSQSERRARRNAVVANGYRTPRSNTSNPQELETTPTSDEQPQLIPVPAPVPVPKTNIHKSIMESLFPRNANVSDLPLVMRVWEKDEMYDVTPQVESVIFTDSLLMFKSNDKFFIDVFNPKPPIDTWYQEAFVLRSVKDEGEEEDRLSRREIDFGFQPDFYYFGENYLYLRKNNVTSEGVSKGFIVVPNIRNSYLMKWFAFDVPEDFDHTTIRITKNKRNFCVSFGGFLWRYDTVEHQLVKAVDCSATYFLTEECDIFLVDDTGLYSYNILSCEHRLLGKFNERLNNVILIRYLVTLEKKIPLIIHKTPDESTIISESSDMIFVNMRDIRWWDFIGNTKFAFINGNNLRIISTDSGSVLFNGPLRCCDYVLVNIKSNTITNVQFKDIIVISTENDIWYAPAYDGYHLTKIDTEMDISVKALLKLVYNVNIFRDTSSYMSSTWALEIQDGNNILDKFMAMAEILPLTTIRISVKYAHKTKVISHGDGVLNTFMCDAMHLLAKRYMIRHNHVTTWNLDELRNLNEGQLFVIGRTIAMYLIMVRVHLCVRLPLILIMCIRGRPPSERELEYFAYHEDQTAFENLQRIRNDPEAMEKNGFTNYASALMFICKCFHVEAENFLAYKISTHIADGVKIFSGSRRFDKMNLPTVDYVLSGPYIIDTSELISKIRFSQRSISESDKQRILNIIKNMGQEAISNLLRNWTGLSILQPSINLYIELKSDLCNDNIIIKFATCAYQMVIDLTYFRGAPDSEIEGMMTQNCQVMLG